MLYWINAFVYAHMMTLYFSTGSPVVTNQLCASNAWQKIHYLRPDYAINVHYVVM